MVENKPKLPPTARYYVVLQKDPNNLKLWEQVLAWYRAQNLTELQNHIKKSIPFSFLPKELKITTLPSNDVGAIGARKRGFRPTDRPDALVVALMVERVGIGRFHKAVNVNKKAFRGGSADIPFEVADSWCPGEAADPIFADRAAAEGLLRVPYLRDVKKRTGKNVNVVIVDQGLNKQQLGGSYGGGWQVGSNKPGEAQPRPGERRRSHGMMIAANVLKVAPDATLFDLPLAPHKISDIPVFLSLAEAAFLKMLDDIATYRREGGKWSGPWVLVNPWGVCDRRSEQPPGSYTNNPDNTFNMLVTGAVSEGIDVVFAAGNCGQFCPDNRCGPRDRGPDNSIFGANSLAAVLTVGAVRCDTMWLGYSSQGRGQPSLARYKPDLCAPSQFRETDDAFTINSGTSAACALAAGVIAGLRSKPGGGTLSPARLKRTLIRTARKPRGRRWNNRLGHGILNAEAAHDAMP